MHPILNRPVQRSLKFPLSVLAGIVVLFTFISAVVVIRTYGVERHERLFWEFLLPATAYGVVASSLLASSVCFLNRKFGKTLVGAGLIAAAPGAALLVGMSVSLLSPVESWDAGDVVTALVLWAPAALIISSAYFSTKRFGVRETTVN